MTMYSRKKVNLMVTRLLFGSGCERVNTNKMAELVGCAPSTLRMWRMGKFPPALRIFARICRIRRLTDEQIVAAIRSFE